jgi:hypothetical protein
VIFGSRIHFIDSIDEHSFAPEFMSATIGPAYYSQKHPSSYFNNADYMLPLARYSQKEKGVLRSISNFTELQG